MLTNKPLVSGIIIFLNEAKYIQEAIESVFAQTYDNWELLLVDDGSTDDSTNIARDYAEKYPEKVYYLEHENHQNRGMAASRNLGVRHARGEYVAFLDADDVWLPNKLTDQVAILESQPEAAMLYGRTLFWHSWTGQPEDFKRDRFTYLGIEPNTLVKPPTLLKLFLENEDTIASCCSILVRREVFDKVGGYEESFQSQFSDLPFYTKLYLREAVFVVDGCWDKYRMHAQNSWRMAQQSGKFYAAREKYLHWTEQFLLEQGAEHSDVWQVLQRRLWPYRYPKWSPWLEKIHRQSERLRHPLRSTKNLLKKTIIGRIYNKYRYRPPIGRLNWGGLRRLKPISQQYGCDRGLPIDRHYIENFLTRHTQDIQGHVLEIAEPLYALKFGSDRIKTIDVLHLDSNNPQATLVGDLADAAQVPSNTFDCFILTQTLQYLYDIQSAVTTIYRILKPGGVVLVTLPCITPIFEPTPEYDDGSWSRSSWYWGFTAASAQRLFEEKFGPEQVTVASFGNVLSAIGFLQGLSTQELKPEELEACDPAYQVLITVRAVKPENVKPENRDEI